MHNDGYRNDILVNARALITIRLVPKVRHWFALEDKDEEEGSRDDSSNAKINPNNPAIGSSGRHAKKKDADRSSNCESNWRIKHFADIPSSE